MSGARKARRRREREHTRRPSRSRKLRAWERSGLAVTGIVLVLAGVGLLTLGNPSTATRLSRVAGILIILGCALLLFGAFGRL